MAAEREMLGGLGEKTEGMASQAELPLLERGLNVCCANQVKWLSWRQCVSLTFVFAYLGNCTCEKVLPHLMDNNSFYHTFYCSISPRISLTIQLYRVASMHDRNTPCPVQTLQNHCWSHHNGVRLKEEAGIWISSLETQSSLSWLWHYHCAVADRLLHCLHLSFPFLCGFLVERFPLPVHWYRWPQWSPYFHWISHALLGCMHAHT